MTRLIIALVALVTSESLTPETMGASDGDRLGGLVCVQLAGRATWACGH